MSLPRKNPKKRYINDLRRHDYIQSQVYKLKGVIVPVGLSIVFLAVVGLIVSSWHDTYGKDWIIVVIAAIFGGYMALNIGANDVANNMGPAVGGKVLTVLSAVLIAAVCESAGALLAGGDVVRTVSKGIISPGGQLSISEFQTVMLSSLLAAALWINLATILSAPVSTTHSIVGGVLGAGIAAAGLNIVNWSTMAKIAASWFISPVLGAIIAAGFLLFIKVQILNAENRLQAAQKWVPILIATMAGVFSAYMLLKGLKKIWKPEDIEIIFLSIACFVLTYFSSKPYIANRVKKLTSRKQDVYSLFNLPLIAGVALLSFAHGANDVANAVGPLAAIVSTIGQEAGIVTKVTIPLWVMSVGAFGIALGLGLFGPKLITVVGAKITRLNSPRAYCVAISAAITVLIATTAGLPVSSTHIAIGAVFGVGFLREFIENPNKRKLRPGHLLNKTADDAFKSPGVRSTRRLVRRRFLFAIAAAWVITVPASALIAAISYKLLRLL